MVTYKPNVSKDEEIMVTYKPNVSKDEVRVEVTFEGAPLPDFATALYGFRQTVFEMCRKRNNIPGMEATLTGIREEISQGTFPKHYQGFASLLHNKLTAAKRNLGEVK